MHRGDATEQSKPHYPLASVKEAFHGGRFVITSRVRRHMALHDWTERDVVACIGGLKLDDFHKSQAHRMHPRLWLDVYRPIFCDSRRYVKFTRELTGVAFVLLSFCIDGEDH